MENLESPAQRPLKIDQALGERLFPNNEWILLIVLAVECLIFSVTGNNFLTSGNAFEITRLAVEIGLLALVMTPIIITGGIDLSVGSMMGLSAVVMGGLWRDGGVSMPIAIAITLFVGLLGGSLNAAMITKLKAPPLIVTLGTFSLFRGIAEGLTRGIENTRDFHRRTYFWDRVMCSAWSRRSFLSSYRRSQGFGGGCTAQHLDAAFMLWALPRRALAMPVSKSDGV